MIQPINQMSRHLKLGTAVEVKRLEQASDPPVVLFFKIAWHLFAGHSASFLKEEKTQFLIRSRADYTLRLHIQFQALRTMSTDGAAPQRHSSNLRGPSGASCPAL